MRLRGISFTLTQPHSIARSGLMEFWTTFMTTLDDAMIRQTMVGDPDFYVVSAAPITENYSLDCGFPLEVQGHARNKNGEVIRFGGHSFYMHVYASKKVAGKFSVSFDRVYEGTLDEVIPEVVSEFMRQIVKATQPTTA